MRMKTGTRGTRRPFAPVVVAAFLATAPVAVAQTVSGVAFLDANRNGALDAGESGVGGVRVGVDDETGRAGDVEVGPKGDYAVEITGTRPVRVRFFAPPKGLAFGPAGKGSSGPLAFLGPAGGRLDVALVDPADCLQVDAVRAEGLSCRPQIGDRVWADLDGDGLQDPGEPGIPGVHVFVGSGGATRDLVTDDQGRWFTDVAPGGAVTVRVPVDQAVLAPFRPSPAGRGGDPDLDSDGTLPTPKEVSADRPALADGAVDLGVDLGFAPDVSLEVLTEVLDPLTGSWLDADGDAGSPGANDGVRPLLAPGETARIRVTLTNTGRADIEGAALGDDRCVPGLGGVRAVPAGGQVVVECDVPAVSATFLARATVTGARGVLLRDRGGATTASVALPRSSEAAGVVVASPSLAVVEEVNDPESPALWRDADPVSGPLGASDARPVELFPGETASYRVRVRNTGNVPLTGASVSDPWCALDVTAVSLAVGEERVFTCAHANSVVDHVSTVRVSGAFAEVRPEERIGPLPTSSEDAEVRVVVPSVSLLTEALDSASGTWLDADAQAGSPGSNDGRAGRVPFAGTAQFRLTVTNTGRSDLVDLLVSAERCGLGERLATLSPGAARTYTCALPNLTAPTVVSATVRATPRLAGGRLAPEPLALVREEAGVDVTAPAVPTPIETAPLTGAGPSLPVTATGTPSTPVTIGGPARLRAEKLGPTRAVAAGSAIYEITVAVGNDSAVPARGVVVREILPPGMTLVASRELERRTWRLATAANRLWTLGDIAAGERRTVRVLVRIDPGVAGRLLTNRAVITAENATRIVISSRPTRILPARRARARVTG